MGLSHSAELIHEESPDPTPHVPIPHAPVRPALTPAQPTSGPQRRACPTRPQGPAREQPVRPVRLTPPERPDPAAEDRQAWRTPEPERSDAARDSLGEFSETVPQVIRDPLGGLIRSYPAQTWAETGG